MLDVSISIVYYLRRARKKHFLLDDKLVAYQRKYLGKDMCVTFLIRLYFYFTIHRTKIQLNT